ncbi:MAG: hypothetical protein M3325_15735 [Actinomycetota bacterium]|nr:hypothetical protein [Actinomycetota bacterium]
MTFHRVCDQLTAATSTTGNLTTLPQVRNPPPRKSGRLLPAAPPNEAHPGWSLHQDYRDTLSAPQPPDPDEHPPF